MAVVEARGVSVRYLTGDLKQIGLKEFLARKVARDYRVEEFWAVRGVTFSLSHGDMLGVVGANGAGKSTLLKAVTGVMAPSEGRIAVRGRVAALLELGSGFDGDLTVRENAYLRGALLGYTRDFMDEAYDDIIAFAGLGEFQDRPFKQLSSGMKSRLGFSIASMVRPDVLVLDEVLAVGDGAFRKRSEAKMREIMAGGAATILVSHSLGQVRSLCGLALWLDRGRQVAFGPAGPVLDAYQRFLDGGLSADEARALLAGPADGGGEDGAAPGAWVPAHSAPGARPAGGRRPGRGGWEPRHAR